MLSRTRGRLSVGIPNVVTASTGYPATVWLVRVVGDVVVQIDPRYFRPTEVETLLGDPTKAKQKLGWTPEITVQEMCAEMVREDLEQATKAALLKKHGYKISISAE